MPLFYLLYYFPIKSTCTKCRKLCPAGSIKAVWLLLYRQEWVLREVGGLWLKPEHMGTWEESHHCQGSYSEVQCEPEQKWWCQERNP